MTGKQKFSLSYFLAAAPRSCEFRIKMGRLAEDPKKRKQLLIMGISFLACSVILLGWCVKWCIDNREQLKSKPADPLQKILSTNTSVVPNNGHASTKSH